MLKDAALKWLVWVGQVEGRGRGSLGTTDLEDADWSFLQSGKLTQVRLMVCCLSEEPAARSLYPLKIFNLISPSLLHIFHRWICKTTFTTYSVFHEKKRFIYILMFHLLYLVSVWDGPQRPFSPDPCPDKINNCKRRRRRKKTSATILI